MICNKMSSFTSLLIISSVLSVISGYSHVPVLVWSSGKVLPTVPSLKQLSSVGFNELLHDALGKEKPMVVVFLEEKLANEDFNLRGVKDDNLYANLENSVGEDGLKYLPSVVNPLKTIKLLEDQGYTKFDYDAENGKELTKPTVLTVSLSEMAADRVTSLKAHHSYIEQVYSDLVDKYPNLLAIYTGKHNSWDDGKVNKRVRRADGDAPTAGPKFVIRKDRIAAVASGISYTDADKTIELASIAGDIVIANATEGQRVDVPFDQGVKIAFLFNGTDSFQWSLPYLMVGDKMLLPVDADIWAPMTWSWSCSNTTVFQSADKATSVTIIGLQVQPTFDETTNEFGQAMDCQPYFSIAIWTGIVVTFLLLAILSWGLAMLMDINNNDRFDDPKGKTITITATD